MMKALMIVVAAVSVSGCLSASTSAKLCNDLNVVNRVVSGVNQSAGEVLKEYTPKKCLGASINGDLNNFSGGVGVGITNE
jgi:hypothetical protein